MTTYRVDGAEVARLGDTLQALANELMDSGDGSVDRWALGPGRSAEEFEDLVGHWRRQRLRLAQTMSVLGDGARVAGGLYVDTEASIGGRMTSGGPR